MASSAVWDYLMTQYISYITLVCSAITGMAAVIALIVALAKKSQEPTKGLSRRLDLLEDKVNEHEDLLASDNKRLKSIEEGNRVTQRAILSLLKHGIDGNAVEDMQMAKRDLEDYLLSK